MEPTRQARELRPLSLFEMNREQAQTERDRMADEHPEATWLVAEQKPGDWAVVKVGLAPSDSATNTETEERAKPDYAEDPRSVTEVNRGGNWVAGG
jgi:hypothetical protein